MRAVIQRVSRARVEVDGAVTGAIGRGLVVLLAVGSEDGEGQAVWLAQKTAGLRVFEDSEGRMNRSLREVGGEVLCVSQFTLYGDVRRGTRPSFTAAAPHDVAKRLYERFCSALSAEGVRVAQGVFGAMMRVELVNEGPVTLLLER